MVFISEAAPGDPSPVLAEAVSSRHEALRRLGPHLPVRRKVPSPRECARVSCAGGASPPRNPAELPPVSCMAPDLTFNTHFITSITQNLSLLHTDSPFIFRTRTFPALSQIRLQNGLSRARLTSRPPGPSSPPNSAPRLRTSLPAHCLPLGHMHVLTLGLSTRTQHCHTASGAREGPCHSAETASFHPVPPDTHVWTA